jgi:hypothetical protein
MGFLMRNGKCLIYPHPLIFNKLDSLLIVFICKGAGQNLIFVVGVLDSNPALTARLFRLVNLNPTVRLNGQSVAFMKSIN